MTEETQAQFFNDLIEVLIHHLGFYLPKDIIGDRVLEDLKDQIDFGIFDGLSVIVIKI